MSLRSDRTTFDQAYALRTQREWQLPEDSPESQVRQWSANVLLVTTSPEYDMHFAGLLDEVTHRAAFVEPVPLAGAVASEPPVEMLAGWYRGERVTVVHAGITPFAFGASYTYFALERLAGTRARRVVVGDCTSLQETVACGDLVVLSSAIRADDIHAALAPPDVPAAADLALSMALLAAGRASARTTHYRIGCSCGAGAGLYDPNVADRAFTYHRARILVEAPGRGNGFPIWAALQL